MLMKPPLRELQIGAADRRWTWAWRKLTYTMPLWERAGTRVVDPTTRRGYAFPGGTNDPLWSTRSGGVGLLFDGSDDYVDTSGGAEVYPGTGDFSAVAVARFDGTGANQAVMSTRQPSGTGAHAGWYMGSSTSAATDTFRCFLIDTSLLETTFEFSGLNVGKLTHWAFTWNNAAIRFNMYMNGVLMVSPTLTKTEISAGGDISYTNALRLGNRPAVTTYPLNGVLFGNWVWQRELSAREVALHAVDPFGMFQRPPIDAYSGQIVPPSGVYTYVSLERAPHPRGMNRGLFP